MSNPFNAFYDVNVNICSVKSGSGYSNRGIEEAWSKKGEALENFVNDYKRAMQEFGATAQETATGAALIQNGIKTIDDAAAQGKLPAVVDEYIAQAQKLSVPADEIAIQASLIQNGFKNLDEAASAGALGVVYEQAQDLAKEIDGLNGKRLEIDAVGNMSVIDEATGKIEKLKQNNITISVNSEGNIEMLNEATGKIQVLEGIGDVHFQVNGEGNIDILDEAQQQIASVDGETGEITVNGDYEGAEGIEEALENAKELGDEDTHLNVWGEYNGKDDIETALSHQERLENKDVEYKITYRFGYVGTPAPNAEGTQNFSGGLAISSRRLSSAFLFS